MSIRMSFVALVCAGLLGFCGCSKDSKDSKGEKGAAEKAVATSRSSASGESSASSGKATKDACAKVVANQLALEKDASIKKSMEMMKDTMIGQCEKNMTAKQAACAAKAGDSGAFADCLM